MDALQGNRTVSLDDTIDGQEQGKGIQRKIIGSFGDPGINGDCLF